MASQQSVVYVDVRIPLVATERVFLQLAVQAASKKFREVQADGSDCAGPTYSELIVISRRAD